MKPPLYRNTQFASVLELRYAVLFDLLGVAWHYEPFRLKTSKCGGYRPDFYLTDQRCFVEVKGRWFERGSRPSEMQRLAQIYNTTVYVALGALPPAHRESSAGLRFSLIPITANWTGSLRADSAFSVCMFCMRAFVYSYEQPFCQCGDGHGDEAWLAGEVGLMQAYETASLGWRAFYAWLADQKGAVKCQDK